MLVWVDEFKNENLVNIPITTGDAFFTECSEFCQVSKHEHSAKRQFAECRTRQRPSLPSVKHSANVHPQQNTSGDAGGPSVILCRVLAVSTRQTFCLCQVLQAWHSAKRFLCRVSIPTLSKVFFLFSNFFCGIYIVPWSTCSNLELFYDFLVYFLNFLCLLEIFSKK